MLRNRLKYASDPKFRNRVSSIRRIGNKKTPPLYSEQDFREFTFTNAAMLHTRNNPGFFKGTVVEQAVADELGLERASPIDDFTRRRCRAMGKEQDNKQSIARVKT
jgi:hypothetical protein